MRTTTFFSVILASAIGTGTGCGGASSSGLFDGPSTSGTLEPTNDAGATHHGDGGQADATTGGPDAGGSGGDAGGGGALDAGQQPDTGIVIDAGPPVIDAGPLPSPPGVYCGDLNGKPSYCSVGTSCCVKSGNGIPGGGSGSTCEVPGLPFCTGVTVECDDDKDCNGGICCGTLVNNNHYTSVRCAQSCDTQNDTEVHFCDLNAATDVCAAEGLQCVPSSLLPGYARCN